jgi:hypothetical protein
VYFSPKLHSFSSITGYRSQVARTPKYSYTFFHSRACSSRKAKENRRSSSLRLNPTTWNGDQRVQYQYFLEQQMDDAIMDPQLVQKLLNLTKEEIDTIVQGCPHVALRLLGTYTTSAIYAYVLVGTFRTIIY